MQAGPFQDHVLPEYVLHWMSKRVIKDCGLIFMICTCSLNIVHLSGSEAHYSSWSKAQVPWPGLMKEVQSKFYNCALHMNFSHFSQAKVSGYCLVIDDLNRRLLAQAAIFSPILCPICVTPMWNVYTFSCLFWQCNQIYVFNYLTISSTVWSNYWTISFSPFFRR